MTLRAEPTDQYLRTFTWNKVRYRADKPIGELIDTLQKVLYSQLSSQLFIYLNQIYTGANMRNLVSQELVTIDNDVKGKFNQYNQVKTNFATLQRKQTYDIPAPTSLPTLYSH